MAKEHILKQSTSTPGADKMKEEIKSWKAERYRRQKIRAFKNRQKEIAHDMNIWYERMKEATLQTYYHHFLINNRKAPYESKSNKS